MRNIERYGIGAVGGFIIGLLIATIISSYVPIIKYQCPFATDTCVNAKDLIDGTVRVTGEVFQEKIAEYGCGEYYLNSTTGKIEWRWVENKIVQKLPEYK